MKTNEVLTNNAVSFLKELEKNFGERRVELLEKRVERQKQFDEGKRPDFKEETEWIRNGDWKVNPVPEDLQDRRVEITGPVDRKMIINALNSGAKVFMADFEDSNSPTWENTINGQTNLKDAVDGSITFYNEAKDKTYKLNDEIATLMVRPRGLHLEEAHFGIKGIPISAALFDFGLYMFHNAHNLVLNGTFPYFYLPKLESHEEAKWWADVFLYTEERFSMAPGTIKATVLIETITAAFEMDEILYELRQHSAGLNCGRWDYIFSYIKKFRKHPQYILPNRDVVTMDTHFLKSYVDLLVKTCHKRGAHAMGGMAAQIPIKNDEIQNQIAMDKVLKDKTREVEAGHDGTWVAHPGLIPLAYQAFDFSEPNQLSVMREDVEVDASDLLKVPGGSITEEGIRHNIRVGLQYIDAWISGNGCVPLYNLMEDAATAEISRTQIWQWVHHNAMLDDNRFMSKDLFDKFLYEEKDKLDISNSAVSLFENMILEENFEEFLTLPAYEFIIGD
tara:strand:- start:1162 stop:2676 length:1515 start_codon:yes stop_codon:yes gene_type:complete